MICRYKVEGIINSPPETVFAYVEPDPNSHRVKWDKAIKELQLIERIDKAGQFLSFRKFHVYCYICLTHLNSLSEICRNRLLAISYVFCCLHYVDEQRKTIGLC